MSLGALRAAAWFFENSLDIFIGVHGGQIKKTNGSWTRHTGWPAAECLDRSFWDYAHPEDAAATGEVFRKLGLEERTECEFRIRTKANDWLWMHAQIVRGEDDWILAILRDITQERLRELDSREARRAAGMLAFTAGVTVWRYNADADTYQINPDFTRPAKPRARDREQTGEAVRATVHPDDAVALFMAWSRTLATGEPGVMSYRERVTSGSWRHMRVAWQGVRQLPSGRWEILGIAQDVTELVISRDAALAGERAALAAAEAKSQFLANVSHEIRTPMNGVLGILRLLKSKPAKGEREQLIDEALASGLGLSDVLNDIIDYSDIEANQIELAREPIDPVDQLESAAAVLAPRAAKKNLRLTVTAQPDIGFVSADPRRWRKMLFHLIGNAVKF
ncbi:MAG: PAS domain-containing sensor histidine kinase, partial [Bradyrhizobium sp.]